ncbi:MAG TPA: hypothetical protein VHB70_08765 [Parafilimonas sp.]|nr:hypothetical protein [Parafilimonas sp.]
MLLSAIRQALNVACKLKMTLRKTLNILTVLTLTFAFIACSQKITGLTKDKISIQKTVFKVQIPKGDKLISKYYGGHGLMFTIVYADSSFFYYTDDWAVATPTNIYYKSVGFYPPPGGITVDSTLSGQQPDGRYWKEIFHWNETFKSGTWIGYKNIPADKVSLADKSILTFKR